MRNAILCVYMRANNIKCHEKNHHFTQCSRRDLNPPSLCDRCLGNKSFREFLISIWQTGVLHVGRRVGLVRKSCPIPTVPISAGDNDERRNEC